MELEFFSKCPLTVCVWADKNGGYDDDTHQRAYVFRSFERCRTDGRKRLVYDSCRGETEETSLFSKISGYVRTRPETILPSCSAAYFSIHSPIV